MKKLLIKSILFIIVVSTTMFGKGFNFDDIQNPNGKPGLLTISLNSTGIEEHYSFGMIYPVTNWLTLKLKTHNTYDFILNSTNKGAVWINTNPQWTTAHDLYHYNLERNSYVNFIIDFHLPIYKLWE